MTLRIAQINKIEIEKKQCSYKKPIFKIFSYRNVDNVSDLPNCDNSPIARSRVNFDNVITSVRSSRVYSKPNTSVYWFANTPVGRKWGTHILRMFIYVTYLAASLGLQVTAGLGSSPNQASCMQSDVSPILSIGRNDVFMLCNAWIYEKWLRTCVTPWD